MSKDTLRSIKNELIKDLTQIRERPILAAFTAMTALFISFSVWLNLVIKFVDSTGFKSMRVSGASIDGPVESRSLPFYTEMSARHDLPVSQTAELSDIAGAMNADYPELIPRFLRFDFESAPLPGLIISALILCAYLIPACYLLAELFGKAPGKRIRTVLKALVIIGGLAWFIAMLMNGIQVRTPIALALSASFWIIYGGLCLHLFTNTDFKHRKFVQPVMMAAGLIVFAGIKFMQTGQFFGSSGIKFETERAQLSEALLTGWWVNLASIFDWLDSTNTAWPAVAIPVVWLLADFLINQVKKRKPFTALLLKWAAIATLIVVLCGLVGIFISTPRDVLLWQYLFLTIGIGLFHTATQDKAYLTSGRKFIDQLTSDLSSNSKNTGMETQEK